MTPRLVAPLRSLAAAEALRVRVSGHCMSPHLRDGTLVDLSPAWVYWPGDVVAFVSEARGLVAHRVIGYRPRLLGLRLWTQADNASHPDAPVARRLVLGRVVMPIPFTERWRAARRLARHLLRRLRARWQ